MVTKSSNIGRVNYSRAPGVGAVTTTSPQPEQETTHLLAVEEVAERWQVKPSQVYRLAREGHLRTVNVGRWRRWRLADIEDFEASGGVNTNDSNPKDPA